MQIKDLVIFDEMPFHFFIKDEEGKYLWVNNSVLKMAQLASLEEIIGKTDAELLWGGDIDVLRKDDREVLETGNTLKILESAKVPSGETLRVQTCKFVGELDGKKCLFGIGIQL